MPGAADRHRSILIRSCYHHRQACPRTDAVPGTQL